MNSPFPPSDVKAGEPNEHVRGRDSIFMVADIRLLDKKTELSARIRNLSAGGMMVEVQAQIKDGDAIEVNLNNIGWVSGSVVWIYGSRFGVSFDSPIDPRLARKKIGQNNQGVQIISRHTAPPANKSKLRPL